MRMRFSRFPDRQPITSPPQTRRRLFQPDWLRPVPPPGVPLCRRPELNGRPSRGGCAASRAGGTAEPRCGWTPWADGRERSSRLGARVSCEAPASALRTAARGARLPLRRRCRRRTMTTCCWWRRTRPSGSWIPRTAASARPRAACGFTPPIARCATTSCTSPGPRSSATPWCACPPGWGRPSLLRWSCIISTAGSLPAR